MIDNWNVNVVHNAHSMPFLMMNEDVTIFFSSLSSEDWNYKIASLFDN